jgi:transcriptional regulator with XRE-family HTH domain
LATSLTCAADQRVRPNGAAPALRREEVASRSNISPTWYTWLEQGRGVAPSADVLDRIAKGLMLTEPERENLYMRGLGRPPEARYQPVDGMSPRLQRVLDAMVLNPAIIKTAIWDVVGWNRAAARYANLLFVHIWSSGLVRAGGNDRGFRRRLGRPHFRRCQVGAVRRARRWPHR